MKRTTAPNNQSNLYVDQTGSTPGTTLVAEDRNLIQEEICNFLEAFGITLDGGDDEQIKDLMQDYLNQKLKTTDDVVFNGVTANGATTINGSLSTTTSPVGGQYVSVTNQVIPRGTFVIQMQSSGYIQWFDPIITGWALFADGGGFSATNNNQLATTITSDGSNYRINGSVKYYKY